MGSHSCQALTFQGRFEAALGCLDEAVWGHSVGDGLPDGMAPWGCRQRVEVQKAGRRNV